MAVAWDMAPIGVIGKTRFCRIRRSKLFLITLNMFVTDPHISQFKIGKHANHNGYVDFFTDLTKTVWDKRRKVLHA